MSVTDSRFRCTARPGTRRGAATWFYVLVWAAAAMAVYLAAIVTEERSRGHTATAVVYQQLPCSGTPATVGSAASAVPDAEAIRRQIISEANLRKAISRLATDWAEDSAGDFSQRLSAAVSQVGRNLRVAVSKTRPPERTKISISYHDRRDADRAVRLVNDLAEHYAGERRTKQQIAAAKVCRAAQEAADQTRKELVKAKRTLDSFLERHFNEHRAWAETLAERQRAAAQLDRQQSVPPPQSQARPMIANPEWVEENQKLIGLERLRSNLLVDRTPAHPEVRQLESQITDLHERLSTIPRQIAGNQTDPPESRPTEPVETPTRATGITAVDSDMLRKMAEAADTFRVHKEALDRTGRNHERAALDEQKARQEQLRAPTVDLELAHEADLLEPSGHSRELLLMSLAVGLVMTVGVGMVSAGLADGPAFASVAQARAMLPVPVVGTIPSSAFPRPSAGEVRRHTFGGLVLVFLGLVAIGVCAAVLWNLLGTGI